MENKKDKFRNYEEIIELIEQDIEYYWKMYCESKDSLKDYYHGYFHALSLFKDNLERY